MTLSRPKIRGDLLFLPDPEDEDRIFVKDPIRRTFFRYNELQVSMARLLDGKRSPEEISALLEEQYDAEIPTVGIERFIARLEKNYLLDVSSYEVDDEKTRAQILKYVRKRGLSFRVKARDGAALEGKVFETALEQLHTGDPCQAARLFQQVLELNPKNERARQVLECVQHAFFTTRGGKTTDNKLVHLFNPDRMLGAIDRLMGRFLFSPFGVLVMCVLLVSSIVPAVEVLTTPRLLDGFGVVDTVVFIIAMIATSLWHELSHGLACKHYGGQVDDVGLMMFYGVLPFGYCDTSHTYLFRNTRHKVIVQLAGLFGHLVIQAIVYHLLALTDPSLPFWKGLVLMQLYWIVSNVQNLIPFLKYDGYYALSDYLAIANLRERSFQFVRDWLQQNLLGVPAETPEPTPRERTVFSIFGPLACLYTVFYVVGLWISIMLPLMVSLLGTVGLLLAAVYFMNLFGRVMLGHLITFLRFVFRKRATIFTPRRSAAFVMVAVLVGLGLSAPWPLDIDGKMVIEPQRRATLRVIEPGLLVELAVKEGQQVAEGQVLARLDSPELSRAHALAIQDLTIAESKLAELQRGSTDEQLAVAEAETRTDRIRQAAARGRAREAGKLHKLGVERRENLLEARAEAGQRAGEAGVSAARQNLVEAGSRVEEIRAAEATVRVHAARVAEAANKLAQLELRSPIAGVVVTKQQRNRTGEWVKPGEELLEIHDVSAWRARVTPDRGQPLDVLTVGLPLRMRPLAASDTVADSKIETILPPETGGAVPVIMSAQFTNDEWRSGMSGRVRISAPSRSVAYRLIAVPLIGIVDYELWKQL